MLGTRSAVHHSMQCASRLATHHNDGISAVADVFVDRSETVTTNRALACVILQLPSAPQLLQHEQAMAELSLAAQDYLYRTENNDHLRNGWLGTNQRDARSRRILK